MGVPSRTEVSLRIFGDDLNPEEVSKLLGAPSTKSQRKGDVVVNKVNGTERIIRRSGMWYKAETRTDGDLEVQITDILSKLTNDFSIWSDLTSKYKVDMFCGVFFDEYQAGVPITPETLLKLGERGILLDLDIYGASTD